jgi:hypothetical protein
MYSAKSVCSSVRIVALNPDASEGPILGTATIDSENHRNESIESLVPGGSLTTLI